MIRLVKRDSELLQMLHQVGTLTLNDLLLVVGDRGGDILKVVWVEYNDKLLNSFRKCDKDILTLSTQFISGPSKIRSLLKKLLR